MTIQMDRRAFSLGVLPSAFFLRSALAENSASIKDVLQPYVDRHELAGAVTVVASRDKILDIGAVGYSDSAQGKRMATDAFFWIASMGKPITSATLMLLVDEGKVNLSDPVEKYLPGFSPRIMKVSNGQVSLQKPQRAITVRNLVTHTSGLRATTPLESPTLDLHPLSVEVQGYVLEPLIFEPGSDWSYGNAGVNTAGRIVEVVSGMRLEDFMQRRLFEPLGMKDTTFWPNSDQLRRLPKAYKPAESGTGLEETPIDQLRYPLDDHANRHPFPAGGMFSTGADLTSFCQMFLNQGMSGGKQVLSQSAIAAMTHDQLADSVRTGPTYKKGFHQSSEADPLVGQGLNWFLYESGSFGHGGAYATEMRVDPRRGLITVWLVQHAGYPGEGEKSEEAFQKAAKAFSSASS